ncbi:hypothetical protein [Rhizobium mesosinicum]|uniref:Uncharacterized protein n=1 Tax=Rhizobium mesosinicum TaxID=335017 RepID=A0ABS7H2L6_9HYPH|nr:hypothetical protein [Rhizobium mesosinicum]MBW9055750.1 hypothetical protein [Rhizobium mesosinicum]
MNRLRAAWPSLSELFIGAPLWGVQMLLSAIVGLYLRNGWETSHVLDLAILYFSGGLLSWPFNLLAGRYLAFGHQVEARFAAFFLVLTTGTVLMTAFLFAMDYRIFYSRWHSPFGSVIWMFQFAFTGASAIYQFLVLGLGLFLPLGLVCLFATSLALAKRMR